jgi:hypothetical protein
VDDEEEEEEAGGAGGGGSAGEYDSEGEEEDGAGPDQLAPDGISTEGSPVQAVWLYQPRTAIQTSSNEWSTVAQQHPHAGGSSTLSPLSPPTRLHSAPHANDPPSPASVAAPGLRPPPAESKRAVESPLLSYDLHSASLRPAAAAPSSPTFSTRPTVEAKRAADQQREARLMAMEQQTQRRKVQLRRMQHQT